jgi:ABC-type glycerol-3-phosphate transport system permease component
MKKRKGFFNSIMYPVVDVVLAGFLWVGGGLALVAAAFAGSCAVILSLVCSMAVPALCIVAIWGILKYFGVI